MSPLAARRARLMASVYRAYGMAAEWSPVGGGSNTTVSVRRLTREEVVNWGDSEDVQRKNLVYVRKSELAAPQDGDGFVCEDGTFRLIAQPRLEPLGLEWLCEVSEV